MDCRKDIFAEIAGRWFFTDPALLAIYCTHELVENNRMSCAMRSGKGRIEYNPDIVSKMSPDAVTECLKIEVIRIMLKHPYERRPGGCSSLSCTLGSDCVLTSFYQWNHTLLFKPEDFKLENNQYYEWYSVKIEQFLRDCATIIDLPGSSKDDRSGWRKEDVEQAKVDQSALWEEDDMMTELLNDELSKITDWGSLSGNIEEQIVASTNASIDYRKVLSGFRASVLSSKRNLTRMRPNRRTNFDNMGSRYRLRSRLIVAVDVSASVTSQMLSNFYGVIKKFFCYGIESIEVMQFDAKVGAVTSLDNAKKDADVCGRGGTDFQCVIDYVHEKNCYDGLIILTDGYAPEPTIPPLFKASVIWVCQDKESYRRHRVWMSRSGRVCVMYL